MNEHPHQAPKKREKHTDCRNAGKDHVDDGIDNIEKQPGGAEDDRLHGIKAHEAVAFLQNVKNNSADQWDTRNRRRDVRRQAGRRGVHLGRWW